MPRSNLEPGAYILDQGNFAVSGNATVNGAGVTIILTSRTGSSYGTVDIRGGSTIAISAPVRRCCGGIPGIAIWIDEHAPRRRRHPRRRQYPECQRCALPAQPTGALFRRLALGTRCSQLVALTVAFTGNSYFRHDCAGAGVSDPRRRRSSSTSQYRPRANRVAGAARVDDGDGVSVDAVPSGKGVEAAGGSLLRHQQGPGDAIARRALQREQARAASPPRDSGRGKHFHRARRGRR